MQRVFTPSERDRIAGSEQPDRALWALWAAKETAYKVLSKSSPFLSAVPRLFPVNLHCPDPAAPRGGTMEGTVDGPLGRVAVRVFHTAEYVHCLGTDEDDALEGIIAWVIRLAKEPGPSPSPDESRLTREAAVRILSEHLGPAAGEIDIRRIKRDRGQGPPVVYARGRRTAIDISLSHDGSFGALVLLPSQRSADRSSRTSRISGPYNSAF